VNKGLVKFEEDGTFTGFIGANTVKYNMWEYIWKTFFTTKEQRSQQASFVPTEYENIYIDREGFIYATNTVFSEYDLLYDNAKPIRRLNAVGSDILIKNDRYPPIGDLKWTEGSQDYGPSKFKDITVLDNDIYIAFDRTRGRLFGYDPQGIMLWAFGNKGNSEGAFRSAVSIEHMGYDLLCLDEYEASITVFTPTEYGNLIYEASNQYLKGDYDGSADTWSEVLRLNANYNLAFIGIGRALMRQEQYGEAMEYFKMAHDRENYGRAYRYYRKAMVEQNIGWIVAGAACLIIIPLAVGRVKKMKWEVEAYERRKVAR
jgi:tetratricopeptide (TPR) repeat protein